jgi:hypothetical protein
MASASGRSSLTGHGAEDALSRLLETFGCDVSRNTLLSSETGEALGEDVKRAWTVKILCKEYIAGKLEKGGRGDKELRWLWQEMFPEYWLNLHSARWAAYNLALGAAEVDFIVKFPEQPELSDSQGNMDSGFSIVEKRVDSYEASHTTVKEFLQKLKGAAFLVEVTTADGGGVVNKSDQMQRLLDLARKRGQDEGTMLMFNGQEASKPPINADKPTPAQLFHFNQKLIMELPVGLERKKREEAEQRAEAETRRAEAETGKRKAAEERAQAAESELKKLKAAK